MDFVWRRGRTTIAIECKASDRWRAEDDAGMIALRDGVSLTASYGVYLGSHPLKRPWGRVLPIAAFFAELNAGRIVPRGD